MDSSHRRIIKNTGLLYFRQIFLMLINLYAVRVTLLALGVVDYGIFNVIASVVCSMSVLTGAMTSASQRFLSFHLGRNDFDRYSRTFTMLVLSFLALVCIIWVICESLGSFVVYDWLTIPDGRREASMWVYHTAILSFTCGLITIPYTSSIIANERMDAFAIFSIVEGVLKLAIAFAIMRYEGDRLIVYGVLYSLISIVVLSMSIVYCNVKFKYCKYTKHLERNDFKELFSYTGWNLFGSVSGILATQGHNILLNIFFGPIVNAAKAIADRIQNLILGFSLNVYMAVSPQIIKSYAAENYENAIKLVIVTSKMSFLLIFVVSFPLLCCMKGILQIWLADDAGSPDMVSFSRLILLYCLVASLEPPISRLIQATGKIRNYQVLVGCVTLAFIPISILVLMMNGSAVSTFIVLIAIMVIAHVVRVVVAHRQVGLAYDTYVKSVVAPIARVLVVGVPLYFVFIEHTWPEGVPMIIVTTILSAICGLFIAGMLGLDRNDRAVLLQLLKNKVKR